MRRFISRRKKRRYEPKRKKTTPNNKRELSNSEILKIIKNAIKDVIEPID